MNANRRARLVWLVPATDLLLIGIASLLDPQGLVFVVILLPVVASFGLVGALVVTRLPGNAVGWILLACGSLIAWATFGVTYATFSSTSCSGCLPGTVAVAFLANATFVPLIGLSGIFLPLLFPTGHLASSKWRPVAVLSLVAITMLSVLMAVVPGPMASGDDIVNPLGVGTSDPVDSPVGALAIGLMILSFVLAVASVVWRFRHGGDVERQQLRWFGYAALLMVAAVGIGTSDLGPMAEAGWLVILGGLALLPIAIGVAILRYRLYDLDRLVSRTIAYAVVTGGLVVVYLAINLGLTTAFSSLTSGGSVAVAASTLVVAALFTPVRRRVQRIVDRRFDRARYDAERTTTEFSERLRDKVDLTAVAADLDETVRAAIAPTTVGVWLRHGGAR